MIHVNYYSFRRLKLYNVCNIYPRSIKSLLGRDSINGNKFNKGTLRSLEIQNDRFVDNYEGSLLDLVFQNYIDR